MCSNRITVPGVVLGLILAFSHLNISAETTAHATIQATTQVAPLADTLNTSATIGQTNPLAMYQEALNYLLGRNGTEKSAEKAANLFKTLAEQNWSSAQHMLGNMYLRGKGVEKNDLLAYKWLSLASKNNMQLAKAIYHKRRQLYESLENNLSSQSLNKVELWITEWKPTTSNNIQLN